MWWFLLFASFFQNVSGCLRVNLLGCGCSAVGVNSGNIQTLIGSNPFVKNITSHPFVAAEITTDSVDKCMTTFQCPAGQTLVILDKNNAYLFKAGVALIGFCDAGSQEWFMDDGVSDSVTISEAFAACVTYIKEPPTTIRPVYTTLSFEQSYEKTCKCFIRTPTQATYKELVGNHQFLSNITRWEWSGAWFSIAPGCNAKFEPRNPYDTIVLLDDADKAHVFPGLSEVYAKCDNTTLELTAGKKCVLDDTCPPSETVTFKKIFPFSVPYGTAYTVKQTTTTPRPAYTTLSFEQHYEKTCKCFIRSPTQATYKELVGNHPFLSNITRWEWSAAYFSIAPGCGAKFEPRNPYDTIVLLDDVDKAHVFPGLSVLYAKCDNTTLELTAGKECVLDDTCPSSETVPFKKIFPFSVPYGTSYTASPSG